MSVLYWIVGFLLLGVIHQYLSTIIGGWSTLSRLYPSLEHDLDKNYSAARVVIRRTTFFPMFYNLLSNFVTYSEKGIGLRNMLPLFCKDIQIPWESVLEIELRDLTFYKKAVLTIDKFKGNIVIDSYPAELIFNEWLKSKK